MNRRSFLSRVTQSTALVGVITHSGQASTPINQGALTTKLYFDIRDFGAIPNDLESDASLAIESGLKYLSEQETGGILVIPDGRFYCLSSITFPRGKKQRPSLLKGLSHSSILDYTKCKEQTVFIADFSNRTGPAYIGFDNIYFLGNLPSSEMKSKNFAVLKKCSQLEVHRCRFDRFNRLFSIHNSYALRFINCDFQDIESDVFAFYTNAHDFRCINTHSYNVSKKDGAFF